MGANGFAAPEQVTTVPLAEHAACAEDAAHKLATAVVINSMDL
ncbi:hypothetical protein CES86_3268 [Brucella lupini]|uniref:Uncharacterized protein n=1 Tax=Brucella lupini TaxID=255457 RepID=A0A256GIE2_9HYPH|nr:hypothetical protein CES86_3268 [Brucella lupini]